MTEVPMGTALANPDDVVDLWADYNYSDRGRVERLIDKASTLLRGALPTVDARIALHETNPSDPMALDPELVSLVIAGIVTRFLRNPDGALNRSITEGPYASSVGYGERTGGDFVERGKLVVTEGDLATLAPDPGLTVASSIRVVLPHHRFRRAW